MIIASPNIRTGLFTLLNGTMIYDGVTIPVYEGWGGPGIDSNGRNYQAIIGEQSMVEDNTKDSFFSEWNCVIEARTEMKGTPVRTHSDAIANLIATLITPTPKTTGLSVTGFQVIGAAIRNVRHLVEEGNGSYLVRTIMTVTFKLNQA